jgi:DNA primase
VVVEGYTDVMACHLAGIPTAVATCGTAFGADHIGLIRRLLMDQDEMRGEVVFTFDGDAAGQKAALKAFGEEQRFVAQTYIAVSPDGMDPCELRLARGDVAVRDTIAARVPLVEFAIRSVLADYDLETAEGRVGGHAEGRAAGRRIKDRALRPEYARRLAGWLGMEVEAVASRVASSPATPGRPSSAGPRPSYGRRRSRHGRARAGQAGRAVAGPGGPQFDALGEDVSPRPSSRRCRPSSPRRAGQPQRSAGGVGDRAAGGLSQRRGALAGHPAGRRGAAVGPGARRPLRRGGAGPGAGAGGHAGTAELKQRLQRVNPAEEPERYGRLFAELVSLEQTVRALRERGIGSL